ncbi:MAG: hypothetical protein ACRD38_12585, partial [Nitrososphaerales archaeon]
MFLLPSVDISELLDALYNECRERGIRSELVGADYEIQVYEELHRKGFKDVIYLPNAPEIDFIAQNHSEAYGVQAKNYRGRIYFEVSALVKGCSDL